MRLELKIVEKKGFVLNGKWRNTGSVGRAARIGEQSRNSWLTEPQGARVVEPQQLIDSRGCNDRPNCYF